MNIYNLEIMNEKDRAYHEKLKVEAAKAEGKKEGKEEKALELAAKMKAEGLGVELICRVTGLTEEQVESL